MMPWMFSREAQIEQEVAFRVRWSVESNAQTAAILATSLDNYRNALVAGRTGLQPPVTDPHFLPIDAATWRQHVTAGTVDAEHIPGLDVWAEQRRISRSY